VVVPNCISQVRGAGITIPIAHQATWPGEGRAVMPCEGTCIPSPLRHTFAPSRYLCSVPSHAHTRTEWCNENFPGQLYPHCTQWQPVAGLVDIIFVTGEFRGCAEERVKGSGPRSGQAATVDDPASGKRLPPMPRPTPLPSLHITHRVCCAAQPTRGGRTTSCTPMEPKFASRRARPPTSPARSMVRGVGEGIRRRTLSGG
jgi:hypothetical protein